MFPAEDSAEMMACFLLSVRREHPDLLDLLPSADEVVRACLRAIPVTVEEVALLDDDRDLHRLAQTQMRQSRQAKNLVNAALWHRDHVDDGHLAEQLRRWIAVKPQLVWQEQDCFCRCARESSGSACRADKAGRAG